MSGDLLLSSGCAALCQRDPLFTSVSDDEVVVKPEVEELSAVDELLREA